MLKLIFSLLFLANIALWFFVATYPDNNLHIIACDVGQGDGILIMHKTTQIIIDGGPGNRMVKCLDEHIPFWDRTIEMVLLTHPQADHYEGLVEVINRYKVQVFTANSLNASAPTYGLLEDLVGREGAKVVHPSAGMVFGSNLFQVQILHPSSEWFSSNTKVNTENENQVLGAYTTDLDPNEFSVITYLKYQNFDALFTGDTDRAIQDLLLSNSAVTDIEYLKVPHHGSKNGLTRELLEATSPELAVISNGKKNRYGHPHPEILKMLNEKNINTLRTDEIGNVEVVSDGEHYWIRQ
jgi:competence protein ComEC